MIFKSNSLKIYFKLWKFLNKRRKTDILFFIFTTILSALGEVFTIYSLVIFLKILSSKDVLSDSNLFINLINKLYNFANISSHLFFINTTLVILILSIIISNLVRLYNIKLGLSISAKIGNDLASKVFKNKLNQNYLEYLNSNSSSIVNIITREIDYTVNGINSVLQGITNFFISIGLISLISISNLKLLFIITISLAFIYLLIAYYSKKIFNKNSTIVSLEGKNSVKIIQETLDSFKDIFINKERGSFLKEYTNSDFNMRSSNAKNAFMYQSPRYVLEAFGIIIILFVSYSLKDESNLLASLGGLAFSLQRLLIAIQGTYGSWAVLKSYNKSIENVLLNVNSPYLKREIKELDFQKKLKFKNVYFKYSSRKESILENISFEIAKNSVFGIIGNSGSGKSTLLDLIMCLLNPSKGSLFLDGREVDCKENKNIEYIFKQKIGHVQQNIYLLDRTIYENIAFGIEKEQINKKAVIAAAKIAEIESFIDSIPNGYNTIIGERGKQLSGGQRQRIGIARAIYNSPDILILDEATSALDKNTEKKVIQNLKNINKKVTIIMVTHRLETIKNCDKVIKISNKQIESYGTADEILAKEK